MNGFLIKGKWMGKGRKGEGRLASGNRGEERRGGGARKRERQRQREKERDGRRPGSV